jgi:hypothetical protein
MRITLSYLTLPYHSPRDSHSYTNRFYYICFIINNDSWNQTIELKNSRLVAIGGPFVWRWTVPDVVLLMLHSVIFHSYRGKPSSSLSSRETRNMYIATADMSLRVKLTVKYGWIRAQSNLQERSPLLQHVLSIDNLIALLDNLASALDEWAPMLSQTLTLTRSPY